MDEFATQSGADDLESAFEDKFGAEETPVVVETQEVIETPENPDELVIEVDENGEPIEVEDPVEPTDPVLELKIDGEIVKKKQSELIANAQKYEAANKRFEEASAIRKEAEALKANIPQQEQQLKQVLEHYVRETQALMQAQQPNWEQLLAENPQGYLMARHQWEQQQVQLMQAKQAQATIEQRETEARTASSQVRIAEERTKLIGAIPEWQDPKKAAEGAKAIDAYLDSQGFSPEIRAGIDSYQVLVVARKAMLYDQAIAKQKTARAGTAQQVQNTRVVRPGPATQVAPKNQLARANATKAFASDPSVNTLASFFE